MEYLDELVSVITPVYNSERFIAETIKSVMAQTYKNWEMIIVDDCSNDNTASVISQFEDQRIKYYKLDHNSGAAVARNVAIEKAKGRYIAFLDADDMWKPDKLDKQITFMKNFNIGFSFTSYEIVKKNNNKVIRVPKTMNYSQFMKNTIIGTSTVIIDRKIIGDFRLVDVRKDHDSMTWAKLLREGNIAYGLNISLSYYRKVSGSISNNKFKAFITHWKNCRKIEKVPLLKCIYYFIFYTINAIKKHYF